MPIPSTLQIFFDNERRNCVDVAGLGVHSVYTPDGFTRKHWEQGLKEYSKKKSTR